MLHTGDGGGTGCNGRPALQAIRNYLAHGYIAANVDENDWGPASTTLEYASRDFAVAQFARSLGDEASSRRLMARASNWRNELHENGTFQARLGDGPWKQPLDGPG